jgi:hypothetical protein
MMFLALFSPFVRWLWLRRVRALKQMEHVLEVHSLNNLWQVMKHVYARPDDEHALSFGNGVSELNVLFTARPAPFGRLREKDHSFTLIKIAKVYQCNQCVRGLVITAMRPVDPFANAFVPVLGEYASEGPHLGVHSIISREINLHPKHSASARARRQGPGLPGPLREAPKQNQQGGLCVLV